MALIYKVGCKVCAQIREENPLHMTEARLFRLVQDYQTKKTTLTAISGAYPNLLYQSIRNHGLKHQNPSDRALAKSAKSEVLKETRERQLTEMRHQNELLQTVINQVMDKLDDGDLKMTVRDGLMAAKIKSDVELKQTDQRLELEKMVQHFASGAGRMPATGKVIDASPED